MYSVNSVSTDKCREHAVHVLLRIVLSHGSTNLTAGEVKCSVLHGVLQCEICFRTAHQQF